MNNLWRGRFIVTIHKTKLSLTDTPGVFPSPHKVKVLLIGFAAVLTEAHALAPIVIAEQAFTDAAP